jgi:hypothetical protein
MYLVSLVVRVDGGGDRLRRSSSARYWNSMVIRVVFGFYMVIKRPRRRDGACEREGTRTVSFGLLAMASARKLMHRC